MRLHEQLIKKREKLGEALERLAELDPASGEPPDQLLNEILSIQTDISAIEAEQVRAQVLLERPLDHSVAIKDRDLKNFGFTDKDLEELGSPEAPSRPVTSQEAGEVRLTPAELEAERAALRAEDEARRRARKEPLPVWFGEAEDAGLIVWAIYLAGECCRGLLNPAEFISRRDDWSLAAFFVAPSLDALWREVQPTDENLGAWDEIENCLESYLPIRDFRQIETGDVFVEVLSGAAFMLDDLSGEPRFPRCQ